MYFLIIARIKLWVDIPVENFITIFIKSENLLETKFLKDKHNHILSPIYLDSKENAEKNQQSVSFTEKLNDFAWHFCRSILNLSTFSADRSV